MTMVLYFGLTAFASDVAETESRESADFRTERRRRPICSEVTIARSWLTSLILAIRLFERSIRMDRSRAEQPGSELVELPATPLSPRCSSFLSF
jgi:hypothetical protein